MGSKDLHFYHKLPRAAIVDWDWLVERYCRAKSVLDLGCGAAPGFDELRESKRLLHDRVREVAREVVGLEIDALTVARMRELGYRVVCDNAEAPGELDGLGPFETIVAGDIIEHVNNPGAVLAAMKTHLAPGGVFVISTPSPFRWYNPVFAFMGRELSHPDHTTWFSPMTLTTLAARHGYRVERWHTMNKVGVQIDGGDAVWRRMGKGLFTIVDIALRDVAFRGNCWLADTIVAVLGHADEGSQCVTS